jgi:hypothetical protein
VCKQVEVNNTNGVGPVLGLIAELRLLEGCRNVVLWHDDVAFDSQRMRVHLHMDKYEYGLDLLMKGLGRTAMSKEVFTEISASLVMALKDCHDKGICHRDIRPQNSKTLTHPFPGSIQALFICSCHHYRSVSTINL